MAEEYPRNLAELEADFGTEEACRAYLTRLRWPTGFRCPRCGSGKAWPVRDLWQCAGCGCQTSVTAGKLFSPSTRCSPNALAPFFWVVTHHMARNHTGNGVRVSWKIVPAATEVWHPHPAHSHRSRTGHAFPDPQRGQRKPAGHRSRVRYARHASSVPKFPSNSVRFRGYSSAIPENTTYWGYLSQADTPPDLFRR